jgi:hypothetical protein
MADYRRDGFRVLFAAADEANHRIIWVHRYERDFDLSERFYLGLYPALAGCLWSGTRFDALEALPHATPSGSATHPVVGSSQEPARVESPAPRSLESLRSGPTVELKVYELKQGTWVEFLQRWRAIVALREAAGFTVEFAVADVPGRRFVWAVSLSGDFRSENVNYLSSDDRRAANVISDSVERFEIPKVVLIPIV